MWWLGLKELKVSLLKEEVAKLPYGQVGRNMWMMSSCKVVMIRE